MDNLYPKMGQKVAFLPFLEVVALEINTYKKRWQQAVYSTIAKVQLTCNTKLHVHVGTPATTIL